MGYEELVKNAWRTGDYVVDLLARKTTEKVLDEKEARARAQGQMEAIAKREAGDANVCLNAHREGIMKLAPFVKFREEKFGAVLFETRSEKVFTLSPTGAAVVREVLSGADAKGVVENLKAKYDDKTGAMAKEAEEFIAQLKTKGLITE